MKRLIAMIFLVAGLGVMPALAADVAPDELVRVTAQDVVTLLKQEQVKSVGQKKLVELVEAKVLPHFDFARMTRLAVGKNWRSATPEQKQSLVQEFRTLLVRTYSSALNNYKDQQIQVKPLKLESSETQVTVKTQVLQQGAQPVEIDYAMQRTPEGWKVFDVIVAGASLVTNYRSTFDQQISDSGIDGLIKSLAEKNRQLEEDQPPKRAS